MEHEDGVYYAGADELAYEGHGAAKRQSDLGLHGDWPAPERLPGPPLAGSASGWQDLGRIVLHPGWAADWLSDDDPRRFYRLDGVQDGEAPGGDDHGQDEPHLPQAVDDLGQESVGVSGEGLAAAEDAPGRLERPEAGEPYHED